MGPHTAPGSGSVQVVLIIETNVSSQRMWGENVQPGGTRLANDVDVDVSRPALRVGSPKHIVFIVLNFNLNGKLCVVN